jgi:hypothetical protein
MTRAKRQISQVHVDDWTISSRPAWSKNQFAIPHRFDVKDWDDVNPNVQGRLNALLGLWMIDEPWCEARKDNGILFDGQTVLRRIR